MGLPLGPFRLYETLNRMKDRASKFDLRLRVVQYALKEGVKPTARLFATTPKTLPGRLERTAKNPSELGELLQHGACQQGAPRRGRSRDGPVPPVAVREAQGLERRVFTILGPPSDRTWSGATALLRRTYPRAKA